MYPVLNISLLKFISGRTDGVTKEEILREFKGNYSIESDIQVLIKAREIIKKPDNKYYPL
ncbi:hypothetical protein ACBZ92_02070 [Priestia aryabhattai]|uniref:hypothetical protein n=1 Tax=Priestia aryabhattai TaxID=412384 RepID=UPI003563CF4B